MIKVNIKKLVNEIEEIIKRAGWEINEKKSSISTNSYYLLIFRKQDNKKEWAIIRISDHKQEYFDWIVSYSISPREFMIEEVESILYKDFGKVGDIL